ncbi:MAG: hypothetical protein ACREOU_09590 [Candidatus Eiseniibacteriota bacterium]
MTDLKIRTFPRSLPKALESVARLVPGYRGYSSKDDRREEDKRLRTQIARCLREASQDLHRAVRTLPFDGVPPGLNRLGQVAKRIDRLVEDVVHSAYGYPGFFEPVRVDERRLELLYRADIAVAESVQGVTSEVEAWILNPDLEARGGESLANVEVALDLAENAWRTRREMLAEE